MVLFCFGSSLFFFSFSVKRKVEIQKLFFVWFIFYSHVNLFNLNSHDHKHKHVLKHDLLHLYQHLFNWNKTILVLVVLGPYNVKFWRHLKKLSPFHISTFQDLWLLPLTISVILIKRTSINRHFKNFSQLSSLFQSNTWTLSEKDLQVSNINVLCV